MMIIEDNVGMYWEKDRDLLCEISGGPDAVICWDETRTSRS